ncbi:MAG: amidase family protein [Nibricoccus sp.]
MSRYSRFLALVVLITAASLTPLARAATFDLATATVSDINAAFDAGALTAEKLTELCIARINAYDKAGPKLKAIITVNPKALEIARALDAERKAKGPRSPLHGIPVVLKDNYNTVDMLTTGGSKALADFQPDNDAFTVARLRAAGAIILAKANLGELARTSVTLSSLGGQTLNPYDLTRTPGGSSGGSGVAVAASFGILAMGTDTGQSIRSPASATSGVGFRGTFGLIGRSGVIPNTYTQDVVGPNTRTVADAALMADVLIGVDANDPSTWNAIGKTPKTYTASLDPAGLKGARIGYITNLLGDGSNPEHAIVTAATEKTVVAIEKAGATVVRLNLPFVDSASRETAPLGIGVYESARVMNQYFAAQGSKSKYKDLAAYVAAAGDTIPSVVKGFKESLAILATSATDPEYARRLERQAAFNAALVKVMDDNKLDALFFTHQRRFVAKVGTDQLERNGFLSSSSGLPALTVPGGFTPPTADAPLGVPVGVEFLGRPFAEPTLIRLAYGFEQTTKLRVPPKSTPALPGEHFDY